MALNSPSGRRPQNFMLLKLKPDRKAGFEDPRGEIGGIKMTECRAEQEQDSAPSASGTNHSIAQSKSRDHRGRI